MITPDETMWWIIATLLANGLISVYICYLVDKRLRKLEKKK